MSPHHQLPSVRFVTLGGVAIVIAGLYFARTVCIPLALALLFSFLLAPLVLRLRHWGLGRVGSVIAAATVAFAVAGFLGWLTVSQLYDLAAKLPQYESNIHNKLQSFGRPDGGIIGRAGRLLNRISQDISNVGKPHGPSETQPNQNPAPAPPGKPLPVEIHRPEATPVQILRDLLKSLLTPLLMTLVVVVFVIFMLLSREDLRDRLIWLIGPGELNLTTQALDDAAGRVSGFLLMQLVVNMCLGAAIAIGLTFVGVPNPFLWGVLVALLRFVPYLGIWIAASMTAALAFAVDPGWSKLLGTCAIFAVGELITYNVAEPWLYGARTGISAIAILAAGVFWTWLWGPIGLLLSTPLTVCLVVLGRYVPQLEFLSVLLGDEPVLTPEARFYQRLLATDAEEAGDLADKFVSDHSLRELYEEIIIPALTLAEADRHRGTLDPNRQRFVFDSIRALIQELGENGPVETTATAPSDEAGERVSVLCLPAADEADELAGMMLSQLLRERHVTVKTAPASALASERLGLVEHEQVSLVCISALPPGAVTPVKYLCKRLRAELPEVRIIVGYWQRGADLNRLQQRLSSPLVNAIATSLQQAVEQAAPMAPMAPSPADQTAETPAIPENEVERLAELKRTGLLGPGMEPLFDRATSELVKVFNVPIGAASLVDERRQIWKSRVGLPAEALDALARDDSICSHVVAKNDLVMVHDTLEDPRFANSPLVRQRGIRFYAGAPLQTEAGFALGSLCLMDYQPRQLSEPELELLRLIATQLMQEVELRLAGQGHATKLEPAAGG